MSCATEDCDQVEACCLEGGCTKTRFPGQQPHEQAQRRLSAKEAEGLKDNAPALNGTKPARTDAHPSTKKSSRKPLT